MEGRGPAKGLSPKPDVFRTQGREDASARSSGYVKQQVEIGKQRFTALYHHIYVRLFIYN